MMKLFLLVLLAVVAVNAQFLNDDDDQITRIMIDDFTVGGNQQRAVVTLTADLFASDPNIIKDASFNSPGCTGLIGCGRDMRMEAISGFNGRSFESEIFLITNGYFGGEWALANPKTSRSIATIQYDGQDGTFDLDLNGITRDFTDGGLVEALKLAIISDLRTTYTVTLYSPNGNTCSVDIDVPATTGDYEYFDTFIEIPIDDFDGNCNLNSIGAMEIFLPSDDAVDAIVRTIQFTGVGVPSETPTPTRTPSPSFIPSQSQTPTPSPSPVIPECICECPLFRCGLIYDVPGDDDDNIDDDNNDDDDLVYIPVYYGPVDDDFDKIVGDDDEDEFISLHGGLTVDHADDDDEATESSASVLTASLVVVLIAALM